VNIKKKALPTVTDKKSFRLWCASMYLNSHHASTLFEISRPNVYKYLSENSSVELRAPVMLVCELINEQSPETRLRFMQTRLRMVLDRHPWPASDPIQPQ
jgi:hypothetical protein